MISHQLPKDMGEKFKQQIRLVILLVFGLALGRTANAEIIGAHLGYEVIKDTLYVNLLVFDNFSEKSNVNRYVEIKSATSKAKTTSYLSLVSQTDISPVCKSACTRFSQSSCTNGFTIVETAYKARVDLSSFESGDCDLEISWDQCCRMGSEASFYITAAVNKCLEDGNSSPQVINTPYPFVDFNDAYSYSWQATDADGDSLVYRLIESKHSEVKTYDYAKGLGHNAPLHYLGYPNTGGTFPKGFHFDSRYGQLQFHPVKLMNAPICVLIEEYRNGKKIGESSRDLMFDVGNISNEKPVVTGLNGTNKTSVKACVGQELCFELETEDLDIQNSMELTWRTDVEDAQISKSSGKKPKLSFCWTPDKRDLSRKDFYIMVMANDASCSLNGMYERLIKIEVVEPFEASFTTKNMNCDEVLFKATTDDGFAKKYTYEWEIEGDSYEGKSLKINGSSPGSFNATVKVKDETSGCNDEYTGTFNIPTPEQVSAGTDQIICPSTSATLAATGGQQFTWFDTDNEELGSGQSISVPLEETSAFIVRSTDDNGCTSSDSVEIKVRETVLKAIAPSISACVGSEVKIEATGGKEGLTWSNFGLVSSDDEVGTYVFKNNATVKVKGKDDNGCDAVASTQVLVDTDCVLPGDVNGDGWVNNLDILGIGLTYNTENPGSNSPVQISKAPYKSQNWGLTFKDTDRDIKHADANSDGIIAQPDVLVIDEYYLSNYSGFITNKKKGTGLPLKFSRRVTKVNGDDSTFEIDVLLGSQDNKAKDIYGITFSIAYDKYVSSSSISFNTDSSWLKSDQSTTIQVVKNVKNKGGVGGEIQVGFSRTNKQAISGGGSIGKLTFVVDEDNIGWADDKDLEEILNFQVKAIKMVNNDGDPIIAYGETVNLHHFHFYGMKQTVENYKPQHQLMLGHDSDESGGEEDALDFSFEEIVVFPNPANGGIVHYTVPVGMSNVQVSVSDLSGKTVMESLTSVTGVNTLDVSSLDGYFIMTFKGSQGSRVIPIIIN